MKRRWRTALDRLSIYLPIILMGILALGTYWLVRNTPIFAEKPAGRTVKHEADYFMRRFAVKTFDATGKLKSEIYGVEARHYPDTDTLEIDQPRIRSFNVKGHLTVATAKRALSNADGSEVQLFGDAVVTRDAQREPSGRETPAFQFRGEFLHAFMNTERIKSHLPVVMTRGNDRFTADQMDYDNLEGIMNLRGRVNTLLVPKPR